MKNTAIALAREAVEHLSGGRVPEAAQLIRQAMDDHDLGPNEIRRVVLVAARSKGVQDKLVLRAMVATKQYRAGEVQDIPMDWTNCAELGYIAPIENVPSILMHGILCHNSARSYSHRSVADSEVQQRRVGQEVTARDIKRPLHSFAVAYLNPRNAMLYRLRAADVGVLMLDARQAFTLPGALVTDKNAAAAGFKVYDSPVGLNRLDYEAVFSESWASGTTRNEVLKQMMQAELLVPDRIPSDLITRVVVRGVAQQVALNNLGVDITIDIDRKLFFDT